MNLLTRIAAVTFAVAAPLNMAVAGALADPVVEPAVVVEEAATTSSAGLLIPLLLLLIIGVALVGNNGNAGNASDARLKTDITQVGVAQNGLPLYHFRYIGLPTVYEGVMAQDVLQHTPEAVVDLPFGYMGVDYGMLGLAMKRVN